MLNVFTLSNGRLSQEEIKLFDEVTVLRPIWIDLENPSAEEKQWVLEHFDLEVPEDATDDDIEDSARFYEKENGELHIRSDFLINDDDPRVNRVAFIMNISNADLKSKGILFSVHNEDIPVFRLLRMRARRVPGLIEDPQEVLLKLFDADAEYSADCLENVHDALETISNAVLKSEITDREAGMILATVAHQEALNGLIKRNLMDSRRAVSFMMRNRMLSGEQFEEARQILRDMDSLDSHTGFLFDKINFLLDASVGFININQNRIIKIFSVASVALLPPTLIASIYGMNFRFLPELNWAWGYPFAIALMLASAMLPMLYFRKRGWLK